MVWSEAESGALSSNSDFAARLFTAYGKMAGSLEKIFADDSDRPKLVISVDEAYLLVPVVTQGTYRPADVFCRVVNGYSHHQNHAVWVVFVSATSKVLSKTSVIISRCSDLPLTRLSDNSDHVAIRGQRLFPPYTQLGWDQSAPRLGDIDTKDVSKVRHIVGYGRPL